LFGFDKCSNCPFWVSLRPNLLSILQNKKTILEKSQSIHNQIFARLGLLLGPGPPTGMAQGFITVHWTFSHRILLGESFRLG
jgi:hypothetical protein